MGRFLALAVLAVSSAAEQGGAQPSPAIANPAAPLTPFSAAKAERLLRERLPCLGCHTLRGEGGRIGPDLSSVRTRRSPAYIAAMVVDPQRVVPGAAMPRIDLPRETRDLIVRYLATRPGDAASPPVAPARTVATDSAGATIYARWCAACHGPGGKGDGTNAPFLPVPPANLADPRVVANRPDDSLYDTIAGGGAIMNRSPRMPPFGGTLTPAEIRALVAHIRTLCRCEGPEWSRPDGAHRTGAR